MSRFNPILILKISLRQYCYDGWHQGVRGEHDGKGRNPEKHSKANQRRTREQKAADEAKEKAKNRDN